MTFTRTRAWETSHTLGKCLNKSVQAMAFLMCAGIAITILGGFLTIITGGMTSIMVIGIGTLALSLLSGKIVWLLSIIAQPHFFLQTIEN